MLKKAGFSRYQQILNILEVRITTGLYAVGSLLPTEAELCAEFSVSRYTVREALRRMAEKGLVSRRQGSGTLVASAEEKQRPYSYSVKSLTEMVQYALDTHYKLISIEEMMLDAAMAERLNGKAGDRWTKLTGLRSDQAGGKPIAYVWSCIPPRLAWLVPELPNCVGPFFNHIEKRTNESITNTDQEVSATVMSPAIAAVLGCDEGSVALVMMRRYMSTRGTLIASFNWHIASEFTYRMSLQRT